MFGAFGFLALGMVAYMLQLSIDPERWDGSWLRASFWCWNVGLALMVFVSVLPVGFLQLEVAFTEGYAAARSLAFYGAARPDAVLGAAPGRQPAHLGNRDLLRGPDSQAVRPAAFR